VVEVGAGTGLVGIALARLGCLVTVTDQAPLLELLQSNVYANMNHDSETSQQVQVKQLLWGDDIDCCCDPAPPSLLIGSDLIYARETIPALIDTYNAFASKNPSLISYLIYIERFEWEKEFFAGMKERGFSQQCVWRKEEILIFKFQKQYCTVGQ